MIICVHRFIIQNKFVPSHLHTMSEAPMGRWRWADIYIKDVSVRFGFDDIGIWKIQTISQEQSNKERPWDVYIHSLSALGRPSVLLAGSHRWRWQIYITSAWGFRRCSFRLIGQFRSLYIVERVLNGSTFLFCVVSISLILIGTHLVPTEPRCSKKTKQDEDNQTCFLAAVLLRGSYECANHAGTDRWRCE